MTKEIRLNAFDMNCVGHIQHGMWTHPRDHSSIRSSDSTRTGVRAEKSGIPAKGDLGLSASDIERLYSQTRFRY